MKNFITGKEADTEQGDQDDYAIGEALKQDGKRYQIVFRNMKDRVSLARRKALTRQDGTMVAYEEFRDEARAKKQATYAAIFVMAVLIGIAIATNHKNFFIWPGTLCVAIGSWIIARGAGLALDAYKWLETVEAQQAKQTTIYVHEASLLRQLSTVYEVMKSPALLSSVQAKLNEEIERTKSKEKKRYIITQSDLARLFLDSSRGAKLGTPIAIFGGVLISLAA